MPPLPRRLFVAKLVYFGWFAAIGAYVPFISLYYRQVGLDLAQIGVLIAVTGAVQLLAAPLWGLLADALRLRRALLPLAVLGSIPPALLLIVASSFEALFAIAVVQSLFMAPVVALADSATMALLGERRDRYGTQRVWGGVGWSLSTLAFGWLSQRLGYGAAFAGYGALCALTACAALALPRPALAAVNLRDAFRALVRDRRWASFLGCVLLIGHNPGLQELAITLASDEKKPERVRLAEKFPTAALAWFRLNTSRWSALRPENGELVAFITPADLPE